MKALNISNIREVMLFPRDRTRLMPWSFIFTFPPLNTAFNIYL
jgi:hypothetical protein